MSPFCISSKVKAGGIIYIIKLISNIAKTKNIFNLNFILSFLSNILIILPKNFDNYFQILFKIIFM